jgi:PilZ domain
MTLRNIVLERREQTRKSPEQFAFLQLEQDDGGTVLDISEGGLRFESFDPVQENGQIHFWFSLNLRERIEGWGEVAWMDAKRKSGGLKFLRLSEEGREQIRRFISGRSDIEPAAKKETDAPDAVASFVSRARPRPIVPGAIAGVTRPMKIPFQEPQETLTDGVLVPMQRHLALMRRQLIIGVLLGAFIACLIALAMIKFSQYRQTDRLPAIAPVAAPVQTESGAGLTSVPKPPTAAGATSGDVFALGNQNQRKTAPGTRIPSASPAETGGATSRQKLPAKPDQLWTMVQAGNGKAAAALAELYIKGEGVPQSCAQARVLLLVASEKQNADAIKRLAGLDKEGCPAN